jgi:DNA repair exonuclease SbcCD ATPase subunit
MDDQNIADISVFENLQADQHDRTGMSQMSVFNKAADHEADLKKYIDVSKKRIKVIKDLVDLAEKWDSSEKIYRAALSQYKEKVKQHRAIDGEYGSARNLLAKLDSDYKMLEAAARHDPEAKKELNLVKKQYDRFGEMSSELNAAWQTLIQANRPNIDLR